MARKRDIDLSPETVFANLMLLAAERRDWRRACRTPEQIRNWQRAWYRNIKRRQAEATEAAWARQRAARPRSRTRDVPFGDRIQDRMVVGMAPGGWYGRNDMVGFAGIGRYGRGKVLQVLLPVGLVERRRNPAWRGVDARAAFRGEFIEPEWLYRLTAKGEAERAALLLMG